MKWGQFLNGMRLIQQQTCKYIHQEKKSCQDEQLFFCTEVHMQMYVYLIHFKTRLHHAGHYIGFSKCLDFRIASHRDGTGAKLVRAITRLGIPWIVIRTWRVDGQAFERTLKNQKHAARFCPLCNPRITDFQNEYVGGDDFCSDFLEETTQLNERMAINSYALPIEYSRETVRI